jgi:hypothetical protein
VEEQPVVIERIFARVIRKRKSQVRVSRRRLAKALFVPGAIQALLLLSVPALGVEVYKYEEESGPAFSQTRPKGKEYEVLIVTPLQPPLDEAHISGRQEFLLAREARHRKNCRIAKRNKRVLAIRLPLPPNVRIQAPDKNGEPRDLDASQIVTRRQEAEQNIQDFCEF